MVSSFGAPKVVSILPDDIEGAVRTLQNNIVNLKTQQSALEEKIAKETSYQQEEANRFAVALEDFEKREFDLGVKITAKNELVAKIENEIAEKEQILAQLRVQSAKSKEELEAISKEIDERTIAIKEREKRCDEKESALNVYANALQEKEKKINKYLLMFDGMKTAITKD